MKDLLCGQLFMYCTLDTSSLEIWVLFFDAILVFLWLCPVVIHLPPEKTFKTTFSIAPKFLYKVPKLNIWNKTGWQKIFDKYTPTKVLQ